MKRLLPLALLLALCVPAQAQRGRTGTEGFFLNAHLNASSWEIDDEDVEHGTETGGGLGFAVGYGFSRLVAVYFNADGARIDPDDGEEDTYTLGHADLGVQLSFGSTNLRPYLDLALTGRSVEFEVGPFTLEARGAGLSVGGGVKYFVSPALALDGALKFTGGEFDEIEAGDFEEEIEGGLDANSFRINLGVSWYPGR